MSTASTSRDAVRIALLLTLLFAIAAIAVRTTLEVVESLPGAPPEATALLSFSILAITLAFMCIAGGVGLWAIRFSTARESRRRVGRFVDELAGLQDGILTVDRNGQTIGSNPALRRLAGRPVARNDALAAVFPCLTPDDVRLLLNPRDAHEIERPMTTPEGAARTLRFRSQPAEDMLALFVSDVTVRRTEEKRQEQQARFQLMGRIANGVAYDFNTLLCGIASHGSLMRRLRPGSNEMAQSIAIVCREAERGISLARHLMDLSHSSLAGLPTTRVEPFTRRAAELLRIALPSAWTILAETDTAFDPVALSGLQLEQVILNLGLLAADTLEQPGTLRISVRKPGPDHLVQVDRLYAAVLLLSASTGAKPADRLPDAPKPAPESETGVILSVVRSVVEAAGGQLDCLAQQPDQVLFRALLPRAALLPETETGAELTAILTGMRLLLAGRPDLTDALAARIGKPDQAVVLQTADAVALLTQAESEPNLDAILIDQRLISQEPDAFLRAIMKLNPHAGIVLLRDGETAVPPLTRGVIVIEDRPDSAELARAILEAKGLARRLR